MGTGTDNKGRIKRFKTYDSPVSIGNLRDYELTTSNGQYLLTVHRGSWEFSMQIDDGQTVNDTFHGMNEALYKYLEDGRVLSWLKKIEGRIAKEEEQEGIHTIIINMGYATYRMKVHKHTGKFHIYYPGFARGGHDVNENLYLINMELPMIKDGILNQKLRDEIEKLHIEIPDTPYYPTVKLTPKENQQ